MKKILVVYTFGSKFTVVATDKKIIYLYTFLHLKYMIFASFSLQDTMSFLVKKLGIGIGCIRSFFAKKKHQSLGQI